MTDTSLAARIALLNGITLVRPGAECNAVTEWVPTRVPVGNDVALFVEHLVRAKWHNHALLVQEFELVLLRGLMSDSREIVVPEAI